MAAKTCQDCGSRRDDTLEIKRDVLDDMEKVRKGKLGEKYY